MNFIPLYKLLPELSAEIRTVTLMRPRPGLPSGKYYFTESFCGKQGCDCRRAYIDAYPADMLESGVLGTPLATINFGWESAAFYRRWMGGPLSAEDLANIMGPALAWGQPQSPCAEALLELFEFLLEDDAYIDRIIRHYRLFRQALKRS